MSYIDVLIPGVIGVLLVAAPGLFTKAQGEELAHDAECVIAARTRHDAMQMRMEVQPLVPGVEDGGVAGGLRAQPARVGQRIGKRVGRSSEKGIIYFFGCLREKSPRNSSGSVKVTMNTKRRS